MRRCIYRLFAHRCMAVCFVAGGACTSINERLCDSLQHRLHICRCAWLRTSPMVARTCAWLRASSLGACTCAYAQLCVSSWNRLYICRCAVVRFVAASLVHVQMHGCVLRLGAPAHMQMHGCALRHWIARTYADARLCASPWSARTCADARLRASSLDRSYICIRMAMRFDAESLAHMHTHGCALHRLAPA